MGMIFMGIIMFSLSLIFVAVLPEIGKALARSMNAGTLLTHVPLMSDASGTDPTMNQGPDTDMGTLSGMSTAMGDLYGTLRLVAFVFMTIVFVLIGLYYIVEQFRLIEEGTAVRMISESVFVILLLFIFPLAYNLGASLINGLNKEVIMTETDPVTGDPVDWQDMATDVAGHTMTMPSFGISVFGQALAVFILAAASFMAILSVAIMGTMRLFMTGAIAALFPLILIFKLIPLTRRAGTVLQDSLIGLMLVTIVAAVFLRFAWATIYSPGIDDTMQWLIAFGTLTAASLIPTMLAGSLGGVMGGASRAITMAVGGAVGGTVAAAGGAMGGFAGGAGRGLAAGAGTVAVAGVAGRGTLALRGGFAGAGAGIRGGGALGGLALGTGAGAGAAEGAIQAKISKLAPGQLDQTKAALNTPELNQAFGRYEGQLSHDKAKWHQSTLQGQKLWNQVDQDQIPRDDYLHAFARVKFGREPAPKDIQRLKNAGMTGDEVKIAVRDQYMKRVQGGSSKANRWLYHTLSVKGGLGKKVPAGRRFVSK